MDYVKIRLTVDLESEDEDKPVKCTVYEGTPPVGWIAILAPNMVQSEVASELASDLDTLFPDNIGA